MERICICGAGTMGSGIAQVVALHKYNTILFDTDKSSIERAKEKIEADLEQLIKKGKINVETKQSCFSRLHFTSDIDDCKADLIIEAIVERAEIKMNLFHQLEKINKEQTIIASNTSSLSISQLAKGIRNPQRMAGLHFFNPAPVMKLVEVVKGSETSDVVINQLIAFTKSLGKVPVVCLDSPGFIVNRVARPYYIESLRLAEEGAASYDILDKAMEAQGFKMGPFRLMDLIGNDVNYAVSCSVYDQLGQPERLRPSSIQKEKVDKGELGKKSGKGYYQYN